jgi:hypothetical protein
MKLKYQNTVLQLRTLQMAFIYRFKFFFCFVLGNGFWGFKLLDENKQTKKKTTTTTFEVLN